MGKAKTMTQEVIITHETDLMTVELTVDLDLYYEPADRDVGIDHESWSADGYEETEVRVYWYKDDTYENYNEWASKSLKDVKNALAFLELGGMSIPAEVIDKACGTAADEFNPDDYYG